MSSNRAVKKVILKMSKRYFRDNLEILREMDNEWVVYFMKGKI